MASSHGNSYEDSFCCKCRPTGARNLGGGKLRGRTSWFRSADRHCTQHHRGHRPPASRPPGPGSTCWPVQPSPEASVGLVRVSRSRAHSLAPPPKICHCRGAVWLEKCSGEAGQVKPTGCKTKLGGKAGRGQLGARAKAEGRVPTFFFFLRFHFI